MHLLAQEEMGLRCLLRVASREADWPLSIPAIALAEQISPEYAAKLLRQLRIGGLLASTRGAGGGYQLARPANDISVWQVLQVLDADLLGERYCECAPGERADCHRTTGCALAGLWRRVAEQLRSTLEATTLAELCSTEPDAPREPRIDLPMVPAMRAPAAVPGVPTGESA